MQVSSDCTISYAIGEHPHKLLKTGHIVDTTATQTLRSGISIIPVELIGLIFGHAATPNDPKMPEVILSHVCKTWRAIALDTSALWTFINIDLTKNVSRSRDSLIGTRVLAYLMRSRARLLNVTLNISGALFSNYRLDLLRLTLRHIIRWKRLTVLTSSEGEGLLVSRLLRNRQAPNLEHLSVQLNSPVSGNELTGPEPLVFHSGAPKLDTVCLDVSSSRFCLPPLNNVTTLQLSAEWYQPPQFSFNAFCSILTLPSLEALSLHRDICARPLRSTRLARLSVPKLRHLRLDGSCIITNLLMYFDAPQLESLIIQDVDLGRASDRGDRVYPMDLNKCFPALKHLTLSGADLTSPYSAMHIARLTRSIKHLVISDYEMCIIYDVELTTKKADIWPKLRSVTAFCDCTLGYEGAYADAAYFLEAAKMRASRKGMTYRFLPDTLQGMDDNVPEDTKQLRSFCNVETITCDAEYIDAEWPPCKSVDYL